MVRVETIHSSKGLQYPVVYYLDRPISFSKSQEFRDDATGVITFYETEQKAPDDFVEKSYEESMRLLYVAMTRATARVVLPYFFKKTKSGRRTEASAENIRLRRLSAEKRQEEWP